LYRFAAFEDSIFVESARRIKTIPMNEGLVADTWLLDQPV